MSTVVRRDVTIINKLGLHARAAAKLVTLAGGFEADIRLRREEREVDAKSIMGVMMLAAGKGAQLEVIATGPDAQLAVDRLQKLVRERFGESE